MIRKAKAVWHGTGRDGSGSLSSNSGVLAATPYSFRTRFENEKGTNPEELIAAAHAGCFTMALAFGLQLAGLTPTELATEAAVTLEPEGQGFRISKSALTLARQSTEPGRSEIRRTGERRREELPGLEGPQRRDHTRRQAGLTRHARRADGAVQVPPRRRADQIGGASNGHRGGNPRGRPFALASRNSMDDGRLHGVGAFPAARIVSVAGSRPGQGTPRATSHLSIARSRSMGSPSSIGRPAPRDAPTLLLLHGFPSSSRMYEPLLSRLSDRYRLIAPDYPGFGHSDWPDPKTFAYTFDHLAEIIDRFTEALGLSRYTLYMQDYGGPVGFRMALAHPERVQALIVQNAVAHNEGLGALWGPRRAFWADRAANESALRANFLSLATTRGRHVGSDPDVDRYDPDLWTDEFAFLSKPGQADIQTDLFLRLPNQRRRLPQVAGMAARTPAAASCPVGQIRPVVRHLGTGSLSPRCPDGRSPCPRRRPLRS